MNSAETSCDNGGQVIPRRGAILAVAAATTVVAFLPMYLGAIFGGWRNTGALVAYCLAGTIPFVVARAVPRIASFDKTWFPRAWSHWLWFLGMVFLLFLCQRLTAVLTNAIGARQNPNPDIEIPTLRGVILFGIVAIAIGPLAEEVFWRGYLLEQLRKVAPCAIAIVINSLLFGLEHLHLHSGYVASIQAFVFGTVLAAWRIRFRSLLPLVLAHMIFNGVVLVPMLVDEFESARIAEPFADSLAEHAKIVHSNPKCRQIAALTRRPVQEAVPAIIGYIADPDENVRTYAKEVLGACYKREAEPYLKEPLSSRDKNTVHAALILVGICHYSAYKQQVRDIAWSAGDDSTQLAAVLTLWDLNDEETLRGIAKRHPQTKTRDVAARFLHMMEDKKRAKASGH